MGLAAAIAASTGNPMAFSYLVGGLVGGAKGAIQGATQTQGGFVDKLKGAANQAGADSMKAGGLAAAASGIGQMASNAAGGAPSTGGEVADAGGTQGGEEFVEPTRPTLDQLKQTGAYKAPKVVQELRGDEDFEDDEDKKRELLFKFDLAIAKAFKVLTNYHLLSIVLSYFKLILSCICILCRD